jgi:hypothetical protein
MQEIDLVELALVEQSTTRIALHRLDREADGMEGAKQKEAAT